MKWDWWAESGATIGGTIALLLFLALFIGIVVWVYRPGSRERYQRNARLPLQDGRHPNDTPNDES